MAANIAFGLPENEIDRDAEELSSDNARMLVIPEGWAHGFRVSDAGSELLYLHAAHYEPEREAGVRFDYPAFEIAWPLTATDISQRYSCHPLLTQDFRGIAV